MNDSLFDIALRHRAKYADEGGVPDNFYVHYEWLLQPLQDKAKSVFEMGVQSGASLKLWADYFPNAQIVGLDIVDCSRFRQPRIHVWQGDQADLSVLRSLVSVHAPFDLIIDDGSRRYQDQLFTFDFLYPRLVNGGLYVFEGTSTSWGNGEMYSGSLSEALYRFALKSFETREPDFLYTACNFVALRKGNENV